LSVSISRNAASKSEPNPIPLKSALRLFESVVNTPINKRIPNRIRAELTITDVFLFHTIHLPFIGLMLRLIFYCSRTKKPCC